MEKIIAMIADDGSVTIETEGFKNSACLKESEKIIKLLSEMGIKTGNKELKLKPEGHIKMESGKNVITR